METVNTETYHPLRPQKRTKQEENTQDRMMIDDNMIICNNKGTLLYAMYQLSD